MTTQGVNEQIGVAGGLAPTTRRDTAGSRIRILIADDHVLFRRGLRTLLQDPHHAAEIEVVAEAGSGREAVTHALELRPDVVLMDLNMADGNGIEATQSIRRACPDTQVLVLSVCGRLEDFRKAGAAGATGYVLKDIDATNLVAAIRAVHHGKTMVNPDISRQLLEDMARGGRETPRVGAYGLTAQERAVLAAQLEGCSDKEIATQLYLSESTIKARVKSLYRKLGVRDRAEAAAFTIEHEVLHKT